MAKQPIKRRASTPTPPTDQQPLSYSELERAYPNLVAHLFDEVYEDGTRRTTSTLLFFVERGTLKACLNDRDAMRSCFMSVASFTDALLALEAGLLDDNLEWRQKRS